MLNKLSILVAGLAVLSSPVLAQQADFNLANRTGYPIRELYVTSTKSKNWGSDLLDRHIIEDGETWKIGFAPNKSQCIQDIMIVFDDDGSEVTWEKFDLCSIQKITLRYNRKTNETTAISE
jgi:hypothetical protein